MRDAIRHARTHLFKAVLLAALVTAAGASPAFGGQTVSAGHPRFRDVRLPSPVTVGQSLSREPRPLWQLPPAAHVYARWPLRADPRRWPRLWANTTQCTLSLDPVRGRHWWE